MRCLHRPLAGLVLLATLVLCASLHAQLPMSSNGSLGPLNLVSGALEFQTDAATWSINGVPQPGSAREITLPADSGGITHPSALLHVYDFTDITLGSGVTVTASGVAGLILLASGNANIAATFVLDGADGEAGGLLGNGGGGGGAGGGVLSVFADGNLTFTGTIRQSGGAGGLSYQTGGNNAGGGGGATNAGGGNGGRGGHAEAGGRGGNGGNGAGIGFSRAGATVKGVFLAGGGGGGGGGYSGGAGGGGSSLGKPGNGGAGGTCNAAAVGGKGGSGGGDVILGFGGAGGAAGGGNGATGGVFGLGFGGGGGGGGGGGNAPGGTTGGAGGAGAIAAGGGGGGGGGDLCTTNSQPAPQNGGGGSGGGGTGGDGSVIAVSAQKSGGGGGGGQSLLGCAGGTLNYGGAAIALGGSAPSGNGGVGRLTLIAPPGNLVVQPGSTFNGATPSTGTGVVFLNSLALNDYLPRGGAGGGGGGGGGQVNPLGTVVLPPACAQGFEGSSSTGTLWSTGTGSTGTGNALRQQMIYARETMPGGNIRIRRLRWRANGGFTSGNTGGTWSGVTINLCTAANPHTAPSGTFASNLGGDLTTVYSGNVTVQEAGPSWPGQFYVDVTLQTPFLYTGAGDLLIEVLLNAGSFSTGVVTTTDYHIVAGTPAARIWSNTAGSPTGSVNTSAGIVVAIGYEPDPDRAAGSLYGGGCYDATFYEFFSPAAACDLTDSAIRMTPNGIGGYTVQPIPADFLAPSSAPFPGADDGRQVANLPWNFPFPGGSTSQIGIVTNGFVWLDGTTTSTDFSATVGELLTLAPRLAVAWTDWNASTTSTSGNGSYHFDVAPGNAFAYATWLNIGAFGITSQYGGPSASSFQCRLYPSGVIEYHYDLVDNGYTLREMVVGIKPGPGNYNDPGNTDLSGLSTWPIHTAAGTGAGLRLIADTRPVLGASLNLQTGNIPGGALFTATLANIFAQVPPIDLSGLGMQLCSQHVALPATTLGVVFGGPFANLPFFIPNNAALIGLPLHGQSVSFVPGINLFGAVTSNGLRLRLGV